MMPSYGGRYIPICAVRRIRSYERNSDKIGGPPHYLVDVDEGDADVFVAVEVREPISEHHTKTFEVRL